MEPGDIIDCPTSEQWNHTAMVLSVDNGIITCVQANNAGNNLVYWNQCFNYNSANSTLKNIYVKYSKYVTGSKASKYMRLWKPSDKVKLEATGYSETPVVSTLKISGQSFPENIEQGAYWTCKGTISSNYTINQVSGYILGSDGNTIVYSKTVNPYSMSYSLESGEIDKALMFDKLSAGAYYYKITAQDSSGKSLTLISTGFTVTAPDPIACSFSGQVTSPVNWAVYNASSVNIAVTATDAYAISSFTITIWFNGMVEQKETVDAHRLEDTYICAYDFYPSKQGVYLINVTAICQNGAEHLIEGTYFSYDVTPPAISNLRAYEDNGDFYCSANVQDTVTGVMNSWLIIRDEGGVEKRFECTKENDIVSGVWSDISGLWTSGKYTITFYTQDKAGNIGYETLYNVVVAEVSSGPDKVYLTVGEEKEVNISINTLFTTEGKNQTEKTDKGMRAIIKSLKPGCSVFRFEWNAKNNSFSTNHNYDIYVYTSPKSPRITRISNEIEGYDVITYEPVQYAVTYELYRKRVDIDSEYQLWEEFTDNKSHTVLAEHTDKDVVYEYKMRAKSDETVDICTNEKYCPISDFSNGVNSEGNSQPEGSIEDESSAETDSSLDDKDIADGIYISGLKAKTYTGSNIKQDIKLYYNKILLKEGTDYTLTYKNNVNVGTAILVIKAKGNFAGSVTETFEIKPKELGDQDVIIEDAVYSYDKKTHKKAPKVTYKGKALKEGKDYIVTSYGIGDYMSVGSYIIKIKGVGNFKGNFDKAKITIIDKQKNISKAIISRIPEQIYNNGMPVEITDEQINVTLAKTQLKKDIDYTVTYINNVNPGKATLVIKGIGGYAGTKKAAFTIKRTPTTLTDSMIMNKSDISTVEIQKNGARPQPKLMSDGNTLMEGKDYILSYKNNKKAGIGTIIIKGKGNYNNQLRIPFTITEKSLTSPEIDIRVPDVPYTGKQNKYQSKPVITDSDGGVLILNRDYIIESYHVGTTLLDRKSNPENGTAITVTIKGMGSYTGTVTEQYMLKGINFSKAVIKVNAKAYTGSLVTLEASDITSATIKTGKNKVPLQFGTDYEIVAYKNNIKKGTATVIFKGKGDYAGERAVKFRIMPTAISN